MQGLNHPQWNELVFEGKNKNYGAYPLRRQYASNMASALFVSCLAFSMAISSPLIYRFFNPRNTNQKELVADYRGQLYVLPAPLPALLPAPPPPPPRFPAPKGGAVYRQRASAPPTPVKYVQSVAAPGWQEGQAEKNIAYMSDECDGWAEEEVILPPFSHPVQAPPQLSEVFLTVEKMPEFIGGARALQKFLAENIRYPRLAERNQIEGTIYVQFVIDPQGKVTQASLVKGIGYGCDEEALRVVCQMPNWLPGQSSGTTVSVKYTLPIVFRLDS